MGQSIKDTAAYQFLIGYISNPASIGIVETLKS